MELLDDHEMYACLRDAIREAGGQTVWARKHGLSESNVSDVVRARRAPGYAVLAALGLHAVTRYRVLKPKTPVAPGAPDAGPPPSPSE